MAIGSGFLLGIGPQALGRCRHRGAPEKLGRDAPVGVRVSWRCKSGSVLGERRLLIALMSWIRRTNWCWSLPCRSKVAGVLWVLGVHFTTQGKNCRCTVVHSGDGVLCGLCVRVARIGGSLELLSRPKAERRN